jgi:RNA polymerase sigma factor (sigma-70 family)
MLNIDVDLIERTLSGETDAYGQLVQRYQKQVYRLAYRILKNSADAADIAQETFLKAYQNLHTLKDKSKFCPWLMRIATNKCYNWIRSRQENLMSVEEALVCEHALHLPPAPDEILIQQELRDKVMKAISELPELDRKVIQLFYLEENSYQEIQQQLGLSKGTLGRRLHQARNLLRQKLQSMYQCFPFLWDFRWDDIFKYISAKTATAFSTAKFFLVSVMVHLMIMASTSFLSNHKRGDNIETGRNQAVHDVTEVILLTAPLATDFKTAFANQRLIASPFLPALTQRTYPTGASPRAVVAGDFDNDGDFDMAVANSDEHNFSILLNQSDGSFIEGRKYQVATGGPTVLAAADLDGDKDIDLVAVNYDANTIHTFFNYGNGVFRKGRQYDIAFAPSAIAVADLDGDSLTDLVVANVGSSDFYVFMNQGGGTFAKTMRYSLFEQGVLPMINAVVCCDFNGDSKTDIATANFGTNDIAVFINKGDGTFAKEKRFRVSKMPYSLCIGDFNGDGKPDLATANIGINQVSVLFNQGNGDFTDLENYAVGKQPAFLATSDINGDGKLDLVCANQFSNDISVLINRGDGYFLKEQRIDVGRKPRWVSLADLNGDSNPDFAVANAGSNNISVLLTPK